MFESEKDPYEIEHGELLPDRCPVCENGILTLCEYNSELAVLGLSSFLQWFYLKCSDCKFKKDIPKERIDDVFSIQQDFYDYVDGKIALEELYQRIDTYQLDCVNDIIRGNRKIICPSCHEEVPEGFDICWNCNSPTGTFSETEDCEAIKISESTDPVFGTISISIQEERE